MKNLISIIIILISLGIFGFFGLLATLDYKRAQQDIASLLKQDANDIGEIEKVEIKKLPFPTIIAHNINIPGVVRAKEARVTFTIASILKRHLQIDEIILDEPSFHLTIRAKYENDTLSYGRAKLHTSHIGQFLSNYPDLRDMIVASIPSSVTDITFDIVVSDQYLTLTNMDVKSDLIACSGNTALARTNKAVSNLKLHCDKIRLVNYELQNVAIAGNADKEILNLTSASGEMASGGSFDISGNITKNEYRSGFDGHIALEHKDLNIVLDKIGLQSLVSPNPTNGALETKVRITPAEVVLHNLTGQIGSLKIAGNSDIKLIGDTPRILLQFNIADFDSTKEYPILTPALNYVTALFKDTQSQGYLAKFASIRSIPYLGSYDFAFASPVIFGRQADSLKLSGAIDGSNLISSFNYLEGANNLIGSATLITAGLKPELRISITNGKWASDYLNISGLLATNNLLEQHDLSKVKVETEIALESLTQNDVVFKDFKFKASNTGNTITVENFGATLGPSNFQINGSITSGSPMTMNLAYIYNGFDFNQITNFFGPGLNISGIANSVGTISTNGNTTKELLYNLYLKAKFIANSLDITGCDIDGFVNKLNNLSYDAQNLDRDFKLATNSGSMKLHQITGDYGMDSGLLSFKNVAFLSEAASGSLAMGYNIYTKDFSLSSLWSLYLRLSESNNGTTSFGISVKKDGQNFVKQLNDVELLKSFNIRANRNPGGIVTTPTPLAPQVQDNSSIVTNQ